MLQPEHSGSVGLCISFCAIDLGIAYVLCVCFGCRAILCDGTLFWLALCHTLVTSLGTGSVRRVSAPI
jgi:hypothetical protein